MKYKEKTRYNQNLITYIYFHTFHQIVSRVWQVEWRKCFRVLDNKSEEQCSSVKFGQIATAKWWSWELYAAILCHLDYKIYMELLYYPNVARDSPSATKSLSFASRCWNDCTSFVTAVRLTRSRAQGRSVCLQHTELIAV